MAGFSPELDEVERTKQQIRDLVGEIAQLSRSDLPPSQFYQEFLNRVVAALAAVGGAVWTLDGGGRLKLEYQLNLPSPDLGGQSGSRNGHGQLLSQVLASGNGALIPPRSGLGAADEETALANPTDHLLVLGVLAMDRQPAGLVEVFQRPNSKPTTQHGYLRFLNQMCALANEYLKNRHLRHMADRQHLWARLESFTEEVHRTLQLRPVAYTVANDGRRFVECDRVSVILRHGRRGVVEAISGQDVVDRRANLVRRMSRLADEVIRAGQPLHYHGKSDELPPSLQRLLTEYVDESGSKSIVIEPLRPVAEGTEEPPCFGALVVERIEDSRRDPAMIERVQLVSRHSTTALKNALEHHRVFLLPVWRFLGQRTSRLRGRRVVQISLIVAAVAALIGSLFVIPWNFRPEAKGELLPQRRAEVFTPMDAEIAEVHVADREQVQKGQLLITLLNRDLDQQLLTKRNEQIEAFHQIQALERRLREIRGDPEQEISLQAQIEVKRAAHESLGQQIELIRQKLQQLKVLAPVDGVITTWKVRELLNLGRPVKRGDVLLSVADYQGDWVLEVRMPEERMGHLLRAERNLGPGERLAVDFILASQPEHSYRGHVREIHQRAHLTPNEGNVVPLIIELDPQDLPRLRPGDGFAVAGAQVRAKVDCGRKTLGYVIFVDVIEFVHARLLF